VTVYEFWPRLCELPEGLAWGQEAKMLALIQKKGKLATGPLRTSAPLSVA